MVTITTVCRRLPLRSSVIVLTIWSVSVTLAQERPLQPVVQGDLAPGAPQTYPVQAGAGDVIFGTFEQRGSAAVTVTVALYDQNGSKLKEAEFYGDPGQRPLGFVTPKNGDYRIRITATEEPGVSGTTPVGGSYTLRTRRQTPAERMKGATAVTPTVRFQSPRMTQLVKDVNARQAGAVERFWSEAEARGVPLIETIDGKDQDFLVTFLWKEVYETHNVRVVGPFAAPQDHYMSHLSNEHLV